MKFTGTNLALDMQILAQTYEGFGLVLPILVDVLEQMRTEDAELYAEFEKRWAEKMKVRLAEAALGRPIESTAMQPLAAPPLPMTPAMQDLINIACSMYAGDDLTKLQALQAAIGSPYAPTIPSGTYDLT